MLGRFLLVHLQAHDAPAEDVHHQVQVEEGALHRGRSGRQRGSLSYPETLRAFVMCYVLHTPETGGTLARAAMALRVSEPTLQVWYHRKAGCNRTHTAPTRGVGNAVVGLSFERSRSRT